MPKVYDSSRTEKKCGHCANVKPLSEFVKDKSRSDGLGVYCAECFRSLNNAAYNERKEQQSASRRELKRKYIEELGGCCSRCGYNEFIAGLDFHHKDNDKDIDVAKLLTKASQGNSKQVALLDAEVKKCILLCRNCHMALHAGEWLS